MASKPVPTRRKFGGEWDEILYLYDKLLFWLYDRQDHPRALRFCGRLARLLRKASPDHQAIRGEECWSLIWEARNDLGRAIEHRENEVRLVRKWLRLAADSPDRESLLQLCGPEDLSDRLDLLAILYHDFGNLDRAIHTLRQSEQLCTAHGIPFDGRDILQEYLAERKRAAAL
jgi:tetratricopeptide (TPR) repeat protein